MEFFAAEKAGTPFFIQFLELPVRRKIGRSGVMTQRRIIHRLSRLISRKEMRHAQNQRRRRGRDAAPFHVPRLLDAAQVDPAVIEPYLAEPLLVFSKVFLQRAEEPLRMGRGHYHPRLELSETRRRRRMYKKEIEHEFFGRVADIAEIGEYA